MGKSYIVVGGGFKGFCDSLQLLNAGHTVHIVDRAPFFGGMSYSGNIKGFAVDKGVHMFDSIQQELADIVEEIMEGKIRKIDFVSVSAFNGKLTDGYSLPDLDSLEDESLKNQITNELRKLAKNGGSSRTPENLLEFLEDRYGKTAGHIFANIFKEIYNIEAHLVQPDAISKTSMGRLKYLDDEKMLSLKNENQWLDDVLAARRKAIGKVDDLVSVYPDSGEAMRGWCDRAQKWLEAKGAVMHLGETIESIDKNGSGVTMKTDKSTIDAEAVVWTNDNVEALAEAAGFEFHAKEYVSGTPMLFATLITKAEHIKNFTYLQNFDPKSYTYRSASAGIYSGQIDEHGNSFVTCECPTSMDSSRWENAEQAHHEIWQECKDLNIVDKDAELVDHSVLRLPYTFKVAKLGYDEKIAEFQETLKEHNDRIIFRDVKQFFRREIYQDSFNVPDLVA